jgi:hypothetical protein
MSIIAKIREGMPVVALDGCEVGKVCAIGTWRLVVTSVKEGRAFDHLIPLNWVEAADKYVFLNKGSRYVCANWESPAALPARPQVKPAGPQAKPKAA